MMPKHVVSSHNILRLKAEINALKNKIEGLRAAAKIDDSGRCRLYGRFVTPTAFDDFTSQIPEMEEALEGEEHALKDAEAEEKLSHQSYQHRPKPMPRVTHTGRAHSGTDKFESPFTGLAEYLRNKR